MTNERRHHHLIADREAGNSFVSRTTLRRTGRPDTVERRAGIINPSTTPEILAPFSTNRKPS